MTATLLVGGGGLLGRATRRALAPRVHIADVRWGTQLQASDLRAAVASLAADPAVATTGWRLVWCAGRSVIASDRATAEGETSALAITLAAAADLLPPGRGGRIVLASSAGGLHADGDEEYITEATAPAPRSPYGEEKLAQEYAVAAAAGRSGWDAVAVRLGPLYGAGQDPAKSQGLISALCRAVINRRPVRLYVPADTSRPYLWADDAGRILTRLVSAPDGEAGALRIRTIPGGHAVTVGHLVETVRRVTHRRPPVLLAPGPEAQRHARHLRLRSLYPDETQLSDPTPLGVGIARLWTAMLTAPEQRT